MHLTTYNGETVSLCCPQCGGFGHLQSGVKVHKDSPLLYICENYPSCDSYVGCHQSTLLPLGTMANRRARKLRRLAHAMFDPLWNVSSNELGRTSAYAAAAKVMGIEGEFHIGNLNEADCEMFIANISLLELEMDAQMAHHHARGAPPDEMTIEILHTLFHPDRDTILSKIPLVRLAAYDKVLLESKRCGLIVQSQYEVRLSGKGMALVFDATT